MPLLHHAKPRCCNTQQNLTLLLQYVATPYCCCTKLDYTVAVPLLAL